MAETTFGESGKSIRWRGLLPALGLSFGLSAILLVLAAPRVVASFVTFSGPAELRAVLRKEKVPNESLRVLQSSLEERLNWVSSPRMASDLGLAIVLQYQRMFEIDLLRKAEDALVASVKGAPANPYAWTRLAYVYHYQAPGGHNHERLSEALSLSILTGPHEPPLLSARLALGLSYWPMLNDEVKRLLAQQIRYAVETGRVRELVDLASGNKATRMVIRDALAFDPSFLERFEAVMQGKRR